MFPKNVLLILTYTLSTFFRIVLDYSYKFRTLKKFKNAYISVSGSQRSRFFVSFSKIYC